jgi:hypothetical protein
LCRLPLKLYLSQNKNEFVQNRKKITKTTRNERYSEFKKLYVEKKPNFFSLQKQQNFDTLRQKNCFWTPKITLEWALNDKRYISRAIKCWFNALDCLKNVFFWIFYVWKIQLFDLELKISFRFDLETRADHNFMFRFDLERKPCVLFKLLCRRKKNKTTMFNMSVY